MFGGGRDRSELESYNPEAYSDSDDPNRRMGCHRGRFVGLNIQNAEPEFFYAWADSDERELLAARHNYYEVVTDDMGGTHSAAAADPHHDHPTIDSTSAGFPGVILVRRTAENERRVRAEEQAQADLLMRGGDSFLHGGSQIERAAGGTRFSGAPGFTHRSHATEGPDPDGVTLDAWTTSSGITD